MQAARKEEVSSMENEQTKIDGRLDRIEVVVVETKSAVKELQTRVGGIEAQVVEIKSGIKEIDTRSDVRGLQHDVKSLLQHAMQLQGEMNESRNRMEDGLQSLRKDTGEGSQSLRKEMGDEFQSVRKETGEGFQSVRKEMEDGLQSLRKEISDAKIWALLIAATMLGVLARGFHWI